MSSDGRAQAVALSYSNDSRRAPRVVAKGYGATAEAIVRRAQESGVYVHGSVELTRLLMAVNLDSDIPPALYLAVAELLAWLHQFEGRSDGVASRAPRVKQTGSVAN